MLPPADPDAEPPDEEDKSKQGDLNLHLLMT